jgi:hypothetical protein
VEMVISAMNAAQLRIQPGATTEPRVLIGT